MKKFGMRISIRVLLILVAVSAVLLAGLNWGLQMWRDSDRFRRTAKLQSTFENLARYEAQQAVEFLSKKTEFISSSDKVMKQLEHDERESTRKAIDDLNDVITLLKNDCERLRATITHKQSLAEYHARLREKYDRYARHPWSTIEPDPPEPEMDPRWAPKSSRDDTPPPRPPSGASPFEISGPSDPPR